MIVDGDHGYPLRFDLEVLISGLQPGHHHERRFLLLVDRRDRSKFVEEGMVWGRGFEEEL